MYGIKGVLMITRIPVVSCGTDVAHKGATGVRSGRGSVNALGDRERSSSNAGNVHKLFGRSLVVESEGARGHVGKADRVGKLDRGGRVGDTSHTFLLRGRAAIEPACTGPS